MLSRYKLFSQRWEWVFAYLLQLYRKIDNDRLTMVAGSLAYVSLLSLVPFITVIFSLLAVFPRFAEMGEKFKLFIFHNFVPAAGDVIKTYLDQFTNNSSQMTAFGIVGLFVTALLLIRSIDMALNAIWQTKCHRPVVYSFAVYWMVLTLGPLFVGSSMAISSLILSHRWLGYDLNSVFSPFVRFLPFLFSFATFWLLYTVVPNLRVKAHYSAIGAFIAALLFELSKKGFALYVALFPTYQLIYGVLAVIPILFVWIYLCWCIVLFGAEVTFSLQYYDRLGPSVACSSKGVVH